MSPADPADTDLVTLPSAHGATETVAQALQASFGLKTRSKP